MEEENIVMLDPENSNSNEISKSISNKMMIEASE
jgi:hypothetical protein